MKSHPEPYIEEDEFGKYLALRTCAHKVFGTVRRCHA